MQRVILVSVGFLAVMVLLAFSTGCEAEPAASPTTTPTDTAAPTNTSAPTATPAPIDTPVPTDTAAPTDTPVPTPDSLVPTPNTAAPELTATPAVEESSRIAFASDRDGNFEIYVMNADGSGQTRLTDNPAYDGSPAWSPDGSRITFVADRDRNWDIYVMDTDGSEQTRLTDNLTVDIDPAWSPDGSRIAFLSRRDIYVMNADGSELTQLTDNRAEDGSPAWSPDGSRIAFHSERDGNPEIYVMNADGSGQTRLTDNPAYDGEPAWSPDGRRLVFVSHRDGNFEIYVMNPDGSERLTYNPMDDWDPVWSPDGRRIAFSSDRDGNYEIYVMNADGSVQTRLTDNPAYDGEPAWSPSAVGDVSAPVPTATATPEIDPALQEYARVLCTSEDVPPNATWREVQDFAAWHMAELEQITVPQSAADHQRAVLGFYRAVIALAELRGLDATADLTELSTEVSVLDALREIAAAEESMDEQTWDVLSRAGCARTQPPPEPSSQAATPTPVSTPRLEPPTTQAGYIRVTLTSVRIEHVEPGTDFITAGFSILNSAPFPVSSVDWETWLYDESRRGFVLRPVSIVGDDDIPSGESVDYVVQYEEGVSQLFALRMVIEYSPPSGSAPSYGGFDFSELEGAVELTLVGF